MVEQGHQATSELNVEPWAQPTNHFALNNRE